MTINWAAFPGVLKARRAQSGLTQAQLAAAIGVQWNTIARLEIGDRRPSLDLLAAIADVFGCSIADLLPETRSRRSTKTKGVR